MIVFDTSVVLELMRGDAANENVTAFADAVPRSAVYTTSIVEAEILIGVASLSHDRRLADIEADVRCMFEEEFSARILPFNRGAAAQYAVIAEKRRTMGRPLEGLDGLIAAVARAAGYKVATRDIADFEGCGVELINPWDTHVSQQMLAELADRPGRQTASSPMVRSP